MLESHPVSNGDTVGAPTAAPVAASGGPADGADREPEAPDHQQLEAHLAQLEAAASSAAEGGSDNGEAVAKLIAAVAGIRLQAQRFDAERSGLQVNAIRYCSALFPQTALELCHHARFGCLHRFVLIVLALSPGALCVHWTFRLEVAILVSPCRPLLRML